MTFQKARTYSAELTRGLIPILSTADMLDVVADCLNELNQRGADLTFNGGVETQWGEVKPSGGVFGASYYTEGSAEDACASVSRTTQLDKAKALADQLLSKERNHAGSGREGHLNEDDLLPLLKALDA